MSKKIRILSIDGGGIRGIIPGKILMYVEKRIQEVSGNPQAKIADYFDFFAGTSTGGILTGIYLCPDENDPTKPRFSAEQALELYLRRGPAIFNASAWKKFTSLKGLKNEIYSGEPLERYLKAYFREVQLSELIKPCIITAYEIEKRYAHFFSRDDARKNSAYDFYLRDVARSSSAAPIYFQAANIKSISGDSFTFADGGLFANNPSMCALTEIYKTIPEAQLKDVVMLSLGTGIKKKPYTFEEAKFWGAIGWVKPIMHIMMSAINDTVDHELIQTFKNGGFEKQYLRLSPFLGEESSGDLDDASPQHIDTLLKSAEQCIEFNQAEIDSIVNQIVNPL